jgi:hypothetical protein
MTKMGVIAKELKDALDELPVHTKQLAEMFRNHRTKIGRNDDELTQLDLDLAKRTAWKDGTWTPNDVVNAGKGDRPKPEDYLDADYIAAHLAQFKDGASRIYFKDSLRDWGPGNRGTTFVFPTSELDRLLAESGGDAQRLAELLGLPKDDFFVNGKVADVEIRNFAPHELDGLRIPSGNEAGANQFWIPGGHLPTGIPEAVVDLPAGAVGANHPDYSGHGSWPGTPAPLTLH